MAPSQVGPDDDGDEKDRSNDPLTPGPGPDDGDEDDDEERDVGPDDDDAEPTCPAVYNEDEDAWVTAYFCDGRLNAFDLTEPVAVYYTYAPVTVWNLVTNEDDEEIWEQGSTDVVSAIQLWAVDTNGNGQMVISVPAAQAEEAFAATENVVLASANGITLTYVPAQHVFWVTAPGYSFAWDAW